MSWPVLRRLISIFSLLLLMVLAVDLTACGRKGPLTVPGDVEPEVREDG